MQDEIREQIRERLFGDEAVRDSIMRRAYEIYERRGGEPGDELEDWLQAENEILLPLIEEELQRGTESQTTSDEVKAEKSATAEAREERRSTLQAQQASE